MILQACVGRKLSNCQDKGKRAIEMNMSVFVEKSASNWSSKQVLVVGMLVEGVPRSDVNILDRTNIACAGPAFGV